MAEDSRDGKPRPSFLEQLGPNINPATEWGWVAGRVAVIVATVAGAILFLWDTAAGIPVLGMAAFALVYDVAVAELLRRNRLRWAFGVGLLLDNATLFIGWWVVVAAQAGAVRTNDLYLILFPVLIIGVIRLGWLLGTIYAGLWLGWMAWTWTHYFGAGSYDVEQLPLRMLFLAATAGLTMRLVSLLDRERRREAARVREFERLEDLKSKLLLTVSHELKSPVTAIKTAVDLLARPQGNLEERQRERTMRVLQSGVDRLERLVQESMEYAQLQTSQVEVERRPTDLAEVVEAVVDQVSPSVQSKKQRLNVSVADGLPPALVDPLSIERVLFNLLHNATKFTPPGGDIALRLRLEGTQLVAEVADNGPGIPLEAQGFIFSEFYRGGRADRPQEAGTGLGLAIAKRLVELHGGTISVRSAVGEGATFTVVLPLTLGDGQDPARTAH